MTREWNALSEVLREAGILVERQSVLRAWRGEEKGGWRGKFGWRREGKEFLPDSLISVKKNAVFRCWG